MFIYFEAWYGLIFSFFSHSEDLGEKRVKKIRFDIV